MSGECVCNDNEEVSEESIPKDEEEEDKRPICKEPVVEEEIKKDVVRKIPWYERLYANVKKYDPNKYARCNRTRPPKDELDFVLTAVYCPTIGDFFEKSDPYLQCETVLRDLDKLKIKYGFGLKPGKRSGKFSKTVNLRNIPKSGDTCGSFGIVMSNGGVERRENIHNVKLGIGSYHSPQTNPGYSRTPCGAFYSI